MSDELIPCPFCGSENIYYGFTHWVVQCFSCKAQGPKRTTVEEAAKAWNNRPREIKFGIRPDWKTKDIDETERVELT